MDLIIEFIGEIIIEGIIQLIQNKKISKWVRYPLIILICTFYTLILVIFGKLTIAALEENIWIGILLLCIEMILSIGVIQMIRKAIMKKDR